MRIADLIRSMAAAGASVEVIALAVEALEAATPLAAKPISDARRERNRRYYESRKTLKTSESVLSDPDLKTPKTSHEASESVLKRLNSHAPLVRADKLTSNPIDTGKKEEKEKARKPNSDAPLLDDGVNPQSLADWQAVRKAKRAGPITPTVIAGLRREAALAGVSVAEAVRIATERGWQGFKAEWLLSRPPPGKPEKTDIMDVVNRKLRESINADRNRPDPGLGFDENPAWLLPPRQLL